MAEPTPADSESRTPFESDDTLRFHCAKCGAELAYAPGTEHLACSYCGHLNEIAVGESAAVPELDYRDHLARLGEEATTPDEVEMVRCTACGVVTDTPADVDAYACVFCGADMIATGIGERVIRPIGVLPFAIDRHEAHKRFREWVSKLRLAPGNFKRFAHSGGKLNGVYVPYWTYDSDTVSDYEGERGEHYWVTESYWATENGKRVRKTRQVQKTRWYPASGRVQNSFDDILIIGSHTLDRKYLGKLDPWDLGQLLPFREEYLAGFRAEKYQVELHEGFEEARGIMDQEIRATIRRDIGGDTQRISDVRTGYPEITFKHILLPVWISAYRYGNRVFQIVINARTGEVQGERPWSKWKIALLIAAGVLGILVIVLIAALTGGGG